MLEYEKVSIMIWINQQLISKAFSFSFLSCDMSRSKLTSFSLSSPVHSQPSLGHLIAKERIFRSVTLSGKTS